MLVDEVFRRAAVDAHRRQIQGVLEAVAVGLARASMTFTGARSALDALIVLILAGRWECGMRDAGCNHWIYKEIFLLRALSRGLAFGQVRGWAEEAHENRRIMAWMGSKGKHIYDSQSRCYGQKYESRRALRRCI